MHITKPAVPIALLLAAAGIVFLVTRGEESSGAGTKRRLAVSPVPEPAPALTGSKSQQPSRRPVSQAEFDQLVAEWLPLNTGPGKYYVYGHEDYAMAERCVNRLGCGEDLLRLMKAVMLQDKGIDRAFHQAVKLYLAKAGPAERALVASITSDLKIRERWCFYAGGGCTPEEVAALAALLANEEDRGAVLLGSALKLAQTDPLAAVKFAAEQDEEGNHGPVAGEVFKEIVASAKNAALYPAMETELAKVNQSARRQLLEQWTDVDIPGLIGHINAHADTFMGSDTDRVIHRIVTRKSVREAFNAVQDLSDPGFFTSAVNLLIPYSCADYSKETMELAQQIASPEEREKAIRHIITYPEWIKEMP